MPSARASTSSWPRAGIVGSEPRYRSQDLELRTQRPEPGTGPGSDPRTERAAEFVCEEDVRQALRAGLKIVLDSRTIVTPAARDLGEEKRVFVDAR